MFSFFTLIFHNIDNCRADTGEHLKIYDEENVFFLKNPQRMLISNFEFKKKHNHHSLY